MRAVAGDEVGAIIEAIGRGRCVLCLGGELTADGSLRRLIGKLIDGLPDAGEARALLERRPLTAAALVRRRLGERFPVELARVTGDNPTPELLAGLGALPFCAVLTTSYDGAVERAFQRGGALPTVLTPHDVAALERPPRGRFVLKLLGDPTRPETVVWGAADLQAALAEGRYRGVVDELFRARSFLFLGFDWSDAELALLLERILSSAGRGEHWAALEHLEPLEREELAAVYGIHVLDGVESIGLARALCAAVQARPPLPADDDLDGWLQRLGADPENAVVLERLEALEATLKERGEHERLVELYVGRTEAETEARARAALLYEAARVLEVALKDADRALTALLAAYREAPSRTRWPLLERLTTATGRFDELALELASQVEALPEIDRADAWAQVATLRQVRLGDLDGALVAAERAITLAPDHAGAVEVRLGALRARGQWRELSLALGRAVLAEASPARKAARHHELARLFEGELDDAAQAAAHYRLALEADPSAPPVEQVALLGHVAELGERLGDRDLARRAWQELLAREPANTTAFEALLRLEEGAQAWGRVVALSSARAEVVLVADRAPLLQRAAQLADERLGDGEEAESLFARALEADPRHVPSLIGLAQLYRRLDQPRKSARLFVEAASVTLNRLTRLRLQCEAAAQHEHGDERDAAIALLQRVLEADPEHTDAAERLSELLWQAGRLAELAPILAPLMVREAPAAVVVTRWARLGTALRALGELAAAYDAYRHALALDARQRDALRGLASLFFDARRYVDAQPLYEVLLQAHEHALAPSELVEVHHHLAVCHHAAGRDIAARAQLQLACAIEPTHRPSRLLQLEVDAQDPRALIDAKRALLPTADRAEQLRLYVEIGDLYLDQLDDPVTSMATWEEGLRLAPDDVRLLHRCLGVSVEQKAWLDAMALLGRLIRGQPKPETRAKYHYTAGIICLEHLGRFADAADHLWASVKGDPRYRRATTALEQMLRDHHSFRELARLLRWLIKRQGPIDSDEARAEQLRLWSELGALHLEKLHDPESAIVAFEVLRRLDPTPARRQRLATVCIAAGGRHLETAIAEHRALLVEDKARIPSYRALAELCAQAGRAHQAAACAEALACLEPDEQHPPPLPAPSPATHALTAELAARLRHPDENPELTALFALVTPAVIASRAQHDRASLSRKRLLAADDERPFARALRRAAASFGQPPPQAVYTDAQQAAPLTLLCAVDGPRVTPVLVLGAPLLADGRDEATLAFEAARVVLQLRPELALRLLLPLPHELAHLIDAAIALAAQAAGATVVTERGERSERKRGNAEPVARRGELAKTTQALRTGLQPPAVDQLAAIGHHLRTRGLRAEAEAMRWLSASDLSINRTAYAVAGDLHRCARVLEHEPRPPTALPTPQRLLDLIWSATTEEAVAARLKVTGRSG